MTTDAVDQFLATVEDTLPPPPEPLEDVEGQGDADEAEADAEGDEMEEGDEDVPAEQIILRKSYFSLVGSPEPRRQGWAPSTLWRMGAHMKGKVGAEESW